MKASHVIITTLLFSGALIHPALADDQTTNPTDTAIEAPHKTTGKEVRKEVREAIDTIKSYSADKRDEALAKAKAAMDDFDARMEKFDQKLKENEQKALAMLKDKRERLARRYEELKKATRKNWEKARSLFLKDYEKMEEEYEEKVDPFLAQDEARQTKDDVARASVDNQ